MVLCWCGRWVSHLWTPSPPGPTSLPYPIPPGGPSWSSPSPPAQTGHTANAGWEETDEQRTQQHSCCIGIRQLQVLSPYCQFHQFHRFRHFCHTHPGMVRRAGSRFSQHGNLHSQLCSTLLGGSGKVAASLCSPVKWGSQSPVVTEGQQMGPCTAWEQSWAPKGHGEFTHKVPTQNKVLRISGSY